MLEAKENKENHVALEKSGLMKTLAQRLKYSRERANLSQSELARRVGIKPQAIQFIESGKVYKPRNILEIAQQVGVDAVWLSTGEGDMNAHANISRGPKIQGHVPLISWDKAINWADDFERGYVTIEADQTLIPTTAKTSKSAFALKVRGDAMEPEFAPEDVIVVDPAREPRHGSFVIARIGNNPEAALREMVVEGGRCFLKPLNQRYHIDELTPQDKICGTVVYKGKAYIEAETSN